MRIFIWLQLVLIVLVALPAHALRREVPHQREQLLMSYSPLVKETAPAVVNIFTKRTEKLELSPFVKDPFFKLFMEDALGMMGLAPERVVRSLGSGVIVRADGYIITNHHVIKDSDEVRIVLTDRREFDAELVTTDSKTDLALLKVDTGGVQLPYLKMRDSDTLEVGDIVLAIGNPFGIGQTVTSGIVSALARTAVGITDYQFFIQTDAAINPGNSGGALITTDGRLIGINTAIYSRSGGSNGIGFATPSNIVRSIVGAVDNDGQIVRPWLGASMQTLTLEMATSIGLDRPGGVIVTRVVEGGPAAKAGIEVGDVILTADDHEVQDAQTLRYRVVTAGIGKTVRLSALRAGEPVEHAVTLEAPAYDPPPNHLMLEGKHPLSGATVANLSPALAYALDADMTLTGVIVTEVTPRSTADIVGLEPGDIVAEIYQQPVARVRDIQPLLQRRAMRWSIIIRRGEQRLKIDVPKG